MTREKELFRAKEEDFQALLDYKKSIKGQLGGGSLTIRHDVTSGEYVLMHSDKTWARCILESTAKMTLLMEGFDRYLAEGERA